MTAATCWHCGEPLPADPPLATVAGVAHPVCCQGCRGAAEWIDRLGLADYYRLRSAPSPRAPDAQDGARNARVWQRAELARHVVRELDGQRREALLLVDGIRCAACVWLIERALAALEGVQEVQANAAARRVRIVWDPRRCDLPTALTALARAGYIARPLDAAALDDSRRLERRAALKRLLVAGFGAMQAMMYASAIYFGAFDAIDPASRELMRWLGLLVATPVVFYAARPFFVGAWRGLRARSPGMDVPVALAIGLIYGVSLIEALRGGGEVYFDSVSMFVFFLLLGRHLEMRARHRAGDLVDALARLTPALAQRLRADGSSERVGALELLPGDRVQVAQGERIPVDGVLEGAACRVDESLLSGESAPLDKRRGDALTGGSLLLEGPATLTVTRVGADTALAGIAALVARAQSQRPRLACAGERAAARFVARILALATLCAVGWSVVDPARALTATLAVLVVSCPCAFALAVPAAITRALSVLAAQGVFVARADAIEQLAGITHAVFDKTGTLTEARLELESTTAADPDAALRLAAALASGSRHPAAQALLQAAGTRELAPARDLRSVAGGGIEGWIGPRRLRLGSPAFALGDAAAEHEGVVLAEDGVLLAQFHLRERLRADARALLDALRADGVAIELASGDAPGPVRAVAAQLGIETWHARMTPAAKLARLQELRAQGARVLAVGDGINDAPVLAGADVAVALAAGAELAQAAGDIVLDGAHLSALAHARALARQTLRVLAGNQRWALAYNLAVVPLGALGWVPPWLAAIGMSASSLGVILHSLRIGRGNPATGHAALTGPVPIRMHTPA